MEMTQVRPQGPTVDMTHRSRVLTINSTPQYSHIDQARKSSATPLTRAHIVEQTKLMLEAFLAERVQENTERARQRTDTLRVDESTHGNRPVTPTSGGSAETRGPVCSAAGLVDRDADCSSGSQSSHDHVLHKCRQKRTFFRRTRERLSIVLRRSGIRRQSDGALLNGLSSDTQNNALNRNPSDSSSKRNRILHPSDDKDPKKKKLHKRPKKPKKKAERKSSSIRDNLQRFVQRIADSPVTAFCVERRRAPSGAYYDECAEIDERGGDDDDRWQAREARLGSRVQWGAGLPASMNKSANASIRMDTPPRPRPDSNVSQEDRDKPQEDRDKPQEDRDKPQEDRDKPQEDRDKPQEDRDKPQEDRDKPQEDRDKPQEDRDKPQEDRDKPQEDRDKAIADCAARLHDIAMEFMQIKEVQVHVQALELQAGLPQGGTSSSSATDLPATIYALLEQQVLTARPDQPLQQLAIVFYHTTNRLNQAGVATNTVLNTCVQFIVDRFSDWLIGRGGYISAIEGSQGQASPTDSELD